MPQPKNAAQKSFVKCLDCTHGIFMQWFQNPIIVYCKIREERTVAQTSRICRDFNPSGNLHPEVIHFDHYEEGQTDPIIKEAKRRVTPQKSETT